MNFKIRGRQYELNRHDVLDAVRNVTPAISDSRHKYFCQARRKNLPHKAGSPTGHQAAGGRVHCSYRIQSP